MANFIWGANGEEVTPEEIAQRKQIAQSLLGQSRQTPAYNWAQGAANMFDSFMGGFMQGRAMRAERANDDYSQAKMAALAGDGAFGGAGTSVNNPQTNAYIGSDSVMKDQPAGDQSDPFGGSGTDVNHPLVQALLPQGGAPASTAPISPVASALVTPSTPVNQVAQGGALEAITQDVMAHLKRAESGGRIDAKNPNSSASGPYQIINATADGIRKNHPELGLTPGWQTDPNQVEIGAKAGAQDNLAALLAKGLHPTEGQFYQSWFTNPSQTSQIAQADPNAPIGSILTPAQIRANPFLSNMTVGDFGNWSANKMGQSTSPAPAQPMAAAQPAPAVGQGQAPSYPYYTDPGPSLAQISDVLTDPHMNQSAKGYASALLQNKLQIQQLGAQYAMRQADPAYRLQMQRNQAEINEANARVAALSGKNQMTPEQQNLQWRAQQAGLQPGTPGYQQFILNGGKMPGQGESGVQTLTPQQAGTYGLDPSKTWAVGRDGVPKAVGDSQQAIQQKQQSVQQAGAQAVDALTTAANSAISLLDQHPSSTTGTLGHYTASWLPGSNAAQLRNQIETIKANGSYATMQQLKGQGISMGQMSDADMRLAAAKAGAINPDAPPAVVKRQIQDYADFVKRSYSGGGPSAQTAAREASGGAQTTATGVKWSVR